VQGGITETAQGSAARTIVETLIEEFYPIYESIDVMDANHTPSQAKGSYLDEYGALMQVDRVADEDDEVYRTRIYHQSEQLKSGSLAALDFAIREIDGVADVQFKAFTHAPGSFTVYIYPTSNPISTDTLRKVNDIVASVASYGIRYFVEVPKSLPVDLYLSLVFKSSTTNAERNFIRSSVVSNLKKLINGLKKGEMLAINQIGQTITNTSVKIADYALYGLTVNDEKRYVQNITPRQDEQLVARTIDIQ
jgi:hypothetical protein